MSDYDFGRKHDHWKTDNSEAEADIARGERADAEFVRKFGSYKDPADCERLADALAQFGAGTLYDLLVAEFDKLTPDQQETFLGMGND